MAIRMWTRGFDLFAPDEHLVFHRYERCNRATFWEVSAGCGLKQQSQERVRRLLTGRPLSPMGAASVSAVGEHAEESPREEFPLAMIPPPHAPIWNLGRERSLTEFEDYAGIDFERKTIDRRAERGGLPREDCFWDPFLDPFAAPA